MHMSQICDLPWKLIQQKKSFNIQQAGRSGDNGQENPSEIKLVAREYIVRCGFCH